MKIRTPLAAALCLALAAPLLGSEQPKKVILRSTRPNVPTPAKKSPPSPPVEATDFYYFEGRRIPIVRSATEVSVRFKAGASAAESLPAAAKAGAEHRNEGRAYRVVEIGGGAFADTVG